MSQLSDSDVVIVSAKRTPMGSFNGVFSDISATSLGSIAISAALNGIDSTEIEEVFMGCVLPAGLGQAPARQAALGAGIAQHAGAMTINKVCGSGMKAIMLAHDSIKAGNIDAAIAGGMENMTQSPYLLPKARAGYRMGHGSVLDHMMLDGLENAYDGKAMGCFAQDTADVMGITREQMDEFALSSLSRAHAAMANKRFDDEIAPVTLSQRKGDIIVDTDENPTQAKPEKIPHLRPAFKQGGTVTAANSSSISDGAAALVVMSAAKAMRLGLEPLAKVNAHATHAMAPEDFTIAPIDAIKKVVEKANWAVSEVDLFEINEAFAMVTLLAMNGLGLSADKVNVNGGACSLGHPIGASGARIVVTLLHALKQRGLRKGIASLCIGGGEATAMAVEIL